MLGYTVAHPPKKYAGENFGLVLATYDAGGWRAAGYYDGATFLKEPIRPSAMAIEQMAEDVYELAQERQVASKYQKMTFAQIKKTIRTDFIYYRWLTPKSKVVVFPQPLPIPRNIFNPNAQRMMTSYDLTEDGFKAIRKLGTRTNVETPVVDSEDGFEESEGLRVPRIHLAAERSSKLVRKFKASLTSLACSVCGFDFEEKYGARGENFIECHHTKPVAKMKPNDKTQLSDLSAVCSNCHRMLHRSPMFTVGELRKLIR